MPARARERERDDAAPKRTKHVHVSPRSQIKTSFVLRPSFVPAGNTQTGTCVLYSTIERRTDPIRSACKPESVSPFEHVHARDDRRCCARALVTSPRLRHPTHVRHSSCSLARLIRSASPSRRATASRLSQSSVEFRSSWLPRTQSTSRRSSSVLGALRRVFCVGVRCLKSGRQQRLPSRQRQTRLRTCRWVGLDSYSIYNPGSHFSHFSHFVPFVPFVPFVL